MILNNEEMINVQGGGIAKNFVIGILGGLAVLLVGFIEGFVNPHKCN